jgi:hypothetical protein
MFKDGGMLASKGRQYSMNAGDDLKNSIVFSWGFLELALWFWVCGLACVSDVDMVLMDVRFS